MSLMPHGFFPRSTFDMDKWFAIPTFGSPSTLDMFDSFDELDSMMGRNFQWLNKPDFITALPIMPRVPQKYRITLDVTGFSPNSIKTEVTGYKLKVWGKEEVRHEGEDFSNKEFKKTYTLPPNSEPEKMVSFVTAHGQLVIEVPLKEIDNHKNVDLFPKIVDTPTGGKQVSLKFGVPENIDPSRVTVSIKDRDIIIKAEDKVEKPDGTSKFFFYKRTTLPENTIFNELKCSYEKNQLSITAPLDLDFKMHKQVPIEFKQLPITKN